MAAPPNRILNRFINRLVSTAQLEAALGPYKIAVLSENTAP